MSAIRPGCDFCGSPSATWIHGSDDVTMIFMAAGRAGIGTALGAWTSCNQCLQPIQRGDIEGLARLVAGSKHIPEYMRRLTTRKTRQTYFAELYRRILPTLAPARPLTLETAERWAEAIKDYQPWDQRSARAVAQTLEPQSAS